MTGPAAPVPEHGGDLAAAAARYGTPADGWIDLSTGINPHPYPVGTPSRDSWARLPDSGVLARLRAAAAKAYGVADPNLVVPAPGTQALIQWLPRLPRRTRVAVVGPTYAEHAAAWKRAGHVVEVVPSLDALSGAAPVVVAVNPNNPDGRRIPPGDLLALAESLNARRGLLVVDEAFADVVPEISLSGHAGTPGLVVLRSFGKFFGLAGMRLGFALAWPAMATALKRCLGPWAVPGPAAEIATAALADEAWIAVTRQRLRTTAARLRTLIEESGLTVDGGTDLFLLAVVPEAASLHAHLARHGLLTRRFPERPDRLRFGLPPDTEAAWNRLESALKSWPGSR